LIEQRLTIQAIWETVLQSKDPTNSNYWRKRCYKSKENPPKGNNTKYSNTIKRHAQSSSCLQ